MSNTKANFFALIILAAFWGAGFYAGHETRLPPKVITKTVVKETTVKVAACGEYPPLHKGKTKYSPQVAWLGGAIPASALRGPQ